MPAAILLLDLAVLFRVGEHSVEVVLLDAHLRRQLRDRRLYTRPRVVSCPLHLSLATVGTL